MNRHKWIALLLFLLLLLITLCLWCHSDDIVKRRAKFETKSTPITTKMEHKRVEFYLQKEVA